MTSPNKYDELFDSDEGNDRIEPITKPEAPIDNSELTVEDNLDAGNASEAIDSRDTTAEPAIESICLLYTSPSPRDQRGSRMPSSA